MERNELVELLSPEGLRLLDTLPPFSSGDDVLRQVSRLRKAGHSPTLVATVLTQARLRERAAAKFGDFASRMLFTEAGLEQATRLQVAAYHAGRFQSAGAKTVADLGCGIGGDAMAMAAIDLDVTAIEIDEVTATVASFNLAPFGNARVVNQRAEDTDLSDTDAVFLDPARRTAGHTNTSRITYPGDYSPSIDFAIGLATRRAVGIKLGPGLERDLIPADAEAQWISVDGQLVEMGLWFGSLARPGIHRAALLVKSGGNGGVTELAAAADSDDAETGELGPYLYEPDGSIIRARLIGDLARMLNARMVSDSIAYLTADTFTETPFATCFRVLEILPAKESDLRRALRERDIGSLEIKKRGVDVDPAALRKRLTLRGSQSTTLVLTRLQGRHAALLVERLASSAA